MTKPIVEIEYCKACHWMLRAAWMAQELLTTFEKELRGVTLLPGSEAGIFEIRIGGETIWSRKSDGGFPDAKALKKRVRDRIDPERDLGHIDR